VGMYYNKKKKTRIPARTVPLLEEDNDLTLTPSHSPVDLPGHTCDLGILYRVHSRRSGFYGAEWNYRYPTSEGTSEPMQPFIQLFK
jgi:hypothetical protein